MNLVGKSLSLTAPISILKKMGHIEGTEQLQRFIEKKAERLNDKISKEDQKVLKEYLPYFSNLYFASIVISNMIKKDMNFTDSMLESRAEIQEVINETQAILSILEIAPQIMEAIMLEIFSSPLDFFESNSSQSNIDKFGCSFPEMSSDFCAGLERTGIMEVCEKVAEMVTEIFQSKVLTPILNATLKCIFEDDGMELDDLDNLDEPEHLELKDMINEFAEDISNTYIFQTVTSQALAKAIEENITLTEIVSNYTAEDFAASTVEEIIFSNDFTRCGEQLESTLKSLYKSV